MALLSTLLSASTSVILGSFQFTLLHQPSLDSWKKPKLPGEWNEHANFTQKCPRENSKPKSSCCDAAELTTTWLCCPRTCNFHKTGPRRLVDSSAGQQGRSANYCTMLPSTCTVYSQCMSKICICAYLYITIIRFPHVADESCTCGCVSKMYPL